MAVVVAISGDTLDGSLLLNTAAPIILRGSTALSQIPEILSTEKPVEERRFSISLLFHQYFSSLLRVSSIPPAPVIMLSETNSHKIAMPVTSQSL